MVATPDGWCAVATYSIFLRPDLLQVFWARMQAGDFITGAVEPLGTSRRTGRRVLVELAACGRGAVGISRAGA